ncbi:MAG: hypothetical protein A2W35_18310 [Chloroflexi bacterium RBG_16_57_11]|nr:MAG: hypothetical protein A2W35_18310 [Chloroflexi bacterium RBG_16_57_11]
MGLRKDFRIRIEDLRACCFQVTRRSMITFSSVAQIRTGDLRVMSEKPVSATSDLQTRLFDPARQRAVLAGLTVRDWLVDG